MEHGHHHFAGHAQGLIRLKLWHASTLADAGELPFEDAIRHRTGLLQLTTFAGARELGIEEDRQGWAEIVKRLRATREASADIDAFEHSGLMLLWPYAEPMVDVSLARFEEFCSTANGPFKFEVANYYADDAAPEHVTLHVRNCYRPNSLFEHLPQVRKTLAAVIDEATDLKPGVEWIQCGSWLNSLPPFAHLFPSSWVETAVPGKPGGHMGWWGQFQNRLGGFHDANAHRFRATGEFPYRHLLCHCPIEELREHLQKE